MINRFQPTPDAAAAFAADPLRSLRSTVRRPGDESAPADDAFAQALDKARAGQLASDRPIRVLNSAGGSLTDAQLNRLAAAADRAEASGAHRAMFLLDGQAVTMDLATRTVTSIAPLKPGTPTVGIDAVMQVPSGDSPSAGVLTPPRVAALNPTLASILESSSAA